MKPFLLFLYSALVFLITAGNLSAAVTVEFQEKALVVDDTILLSDIAKLTPDSEAGVKLGKMIVSSSPAPGEEKILQSASLITSLRHAAHAKEARWTGSSRVTVSRKSVTVKQDQLFNIIAQYLAENKDKLPQGDIRFTSLRAPSEIRLPFGEVTWRVTPSRPSLAESSSFSIFFKVNNKPAQNCTVRGRVEVVTAVAVSTETIRRGSIISPGQIKMERKDILSIDHPILSRTQVVGMQAARTIRAEKAVEKDHISAPPVIESGEMVKIRAGKGNLRVTTKGVARSSGIIGDTIRVKNIRSNKIIHARVDGPGMVSVEF